MFISLDRHDNASNSSFFFLSSTEWNQMNFILPLSNNMNDKKYTVRLSIGFGLLDVNEGQTHNRTPTPRPRLCLFVSSQYALHHNVIFLRCGKSNFICLYFTFRQLFYSSFQFYLHAFMHFRYFIFHRVSVYMFACMYVCLLRLCSMRLNTISILKYENVVHEVNHNWVTTAKERRRTLASLSFVCSLALRFLTLIFTIFMCICMCASPQFIYSVMSSFIGHCSELRAI